jgi:choline dehydrogenase-like flavoprotein
VDQDLKALGINLDDEFAEIESEIPITVDHRHLWWQTTKELFMVFQDMGLNPEPLPKMGRYSRCHRCGRCVLGCPSGTKWDSRHFLQDALDKGADLITKCQVTQVKIANGEAVGVEAQQGFRSRFFPADLVVLSAGGLGTPPILKNSGLECEPNLFVDPVLCVAAEWNRYFQNHEMPMPFVARQENSILSPYFDHLSYFFNRNWKGPARSILSLMIKLADTNSGSASSQGIDKELSELDKERLEDAVTICQEIFAQLGISKEKTFLGTINAGHPGGMLPLRESEAETFHRSELPENCYVADATLFPKSLGNPPILTIVAMAKRIAKICMGTFSNP